MKLMSFARYGRKIWMPWGFTILGFNNLRISFWEATIIRGCHPVFLGLVPLTHFFGTPGCDVPIAPMPLRHKAPNSWSALDISSRQPPRRSRSALTNSVEVWRQKKGPWNLCIFNWMYSIPSQCIFSGPGDACEGIGSLVVMKPFSVDFSSRWCALIWRLMRILRIAARMKPSNRLASATATVECRCLWCLGGMLFVKFQSVAAKWPALYSMSLCIW